MRHLLAFVGVLGVLSGCVVGTDEVGTATHAHKHSSHRWGEVLSMFDAPGFPEGIAVDGDRFYVAGPANFDLTTATVRAYHRKTGTLLETIPVTHSGADPTDALTCVAVDAAGRLYVLSEALGVVRLKRHHHTWHQEVYAPLPADGLPGCTHTGQFEPDPNDPMGRPACHLLNDLAFDAHGALFVTDSVRATIYRVAKGGGTMEPWFTSPYLLGGPPYPIGVNGIRVSPTNAKVYFGVTTSPLPELGGRGALYKLPNVAAPAPSDLVPVHYFDPGLGPDGFAFGELGELYVTLAFSNQIAILAPWGDEIMRMNGPMGSEIPYDAPANLAFDRSGSLLVTNHALLSGLPEDMAVLRVFVGDRGMPLFQPGHHH